MSCKQKSLHFIIPAIFWWGRNFCVQYTVCFFMFFFQFFTIFSNFHYFFQFFTIFSIFHYFYFSKIEKFKEINPISRNFVRFSKVSQKYWFLYTNLNNVISIHNFERFSIYTWNKHTKNAFLKYNFENIDFYIGFWKIVFLFWTSLFLKT